MSRRAAVAIAIATAAVAGAAPAASARTVHFRTPTNGINCVAVTGTRPWVDCLVKRATWATAPRPASCQDLEWVPNQVRLSGRKVTTGSCRGDVGPLCIPGTEPCIVLRYGRSVRIGLVTCTARRSALTCRRRDGGREGFRVSRMRLVRYR